ncbi:FMRFamide-activated amiloride-sensitive sodium channel-like isoform X2 [Ruditapes philippinarum]|uniref:FMRFamide-activated amiloride-sensitive sodium channel-like isoform X2 n=1 Tax=Ruditapes philippinarum TaxID=129788 RepID=UPI00295C3A7E|nr:FMRFamide-activated amiloride-sensitive sodium channel-like isoform X2 [Ruditapes philippinarum]
MKKCVIGQKMCTDGCYHVKVYARRKRDIERTKSENKHLLETEGKAMFKALTRSLNDKIIKENKHAEGKHNNITDVRRENKPKVSFQKFTFSYLNTEKRLKLNNHEQLKNTQTVRQNGEGLRNRRDADITTKATEAASYSVTKASSDSVTKDAVTKASSDSVIKDAVTKASSDSVTKDAVTKANSDSVTKDAVTKANSDSVTNNGQSDELTSSTIDYDYDYDDDYDYYYDYDYYDLYEDFYWDDWFEEELYLKQLRLTKDEWDARVENFKEAIKIKPMHLRRKMGHQFEDMVQNVTFAGRVQKDRKLKNFTSAEYGNCYTLAHREFVAVRSGPSNAMKLTLNVEIDEYIDNLSTGYGIRIVFHEHGTYPLPSHEGITLSPGSETNIGLRMVRILRLPEPYGNCSDGREFARKYQKKYSISACYEFCRILEIIETCNCLPAEAPDEVPLNKTSLPVCNTTEEAVEKCILKVNVELDNGDISCDCHPPCRETVYTKKTSSTFWPSDDYLKVLITEVCNNKSHSDFWDAPCSGMEKLASHELDKYRRNFLRVLIYFEDLHYELIEEEPIYEPVRFISDIGGTIGLFLGASALTFVELLQLVLELILFIKPKNQNVNSSKNQNVNSENSERDSETLL